MSRNLVSFDGNKTVYDVTRDKYTDFTKVFFAFKNTVSQKAYTYNCNCMCSISVHSRDISIYVANQHMFVYYIN
jgi:hypothetical protein